MKHKRTDKDYGSGSGIEKFNSVFFRVVWWNHGLIGHEKRTVLEIKGVDKSIQFDGHINLLSDKSCMEQLNITEIKSIIFAYGKEQYEIGESNARFKIREALGIR